MAFIVEITSRSGRVMERHRITGDRITLGRGYDNDVILADPYVGVHHCVVEGPSSPAAEPVTDDATGGDAQAFREPVVHGRGSHRWLVRPASDEVVVHLNGRRLADTAGVLESGGSLVVGRTHLRIYAPDHPVEPMLVFDRIEQLFATLASSAGVLWSVVAFAVLLLGDLYLRSWHELEPAFVLQELFGYVGMTIAWAAVGAVVARISRGEPRFFHHWLVAALAVAVAVLGQFWIDVIAFNTASVDARELLARILNGLCLAFALTLNLRFSLRQTVLARHAWAQGFAWAVVGYGMLTSIQIDNFFAGAPRYDGTVLPDVWRFAGAVPAEAFIGENVSLYEVPEDEAGDEPDKPAG